jgi:hypothetical protein
MPSSRPPQSQGEIDALKALIIQCNEDKAELQKKYKKWKNRMKVAKMTRVDI